MPTLTAYEAIEVAVQHHQAGRPAEAEAILRRILIDEPSHAGVWHRLGRIVMDTGQVDQAVAALREAVRLNPHFVEAHYDLGIALMNLQRSEEAIAAWRRVIQLEPDHAAAYGQMAQAFRVAGRVDEAIEAIAACTRAIESQSVRARESCAAGLALSRQGRNDEALVAYSRAVQLDPALAEAHHGLSVILEHKGQIDSALAASTTAIRLMPNFADGHNGLGVARRRKGLLAEAIEAFATAVQIDPAHAHAPNNLGCALSESDRLDDAIAVFQSAVRARPDSWATYNNLGNAWRQVGELDEAVSCYRKALELQPGYVLAHSNLLYALHGHPDCDAADLLAQHLEWNEAHARHLRPILGDHDNDANPDRRLRVGYVSPDFRRHPVGFFLLPLLSAHDKRQFEVFCYSDVVARDDVTEELRAHASVWRDIAGLTDERVAALVRHDRIDVLVDLTMHTADTRLLVFARKPAPVQVTYLAYCGTTGLKTMDYRITDPYLDPPAQGHTHYSEQSTWVRETYWCYRPVVSIDVREAPALTVGRPTFGCLNDFSKVGAATLTIWCRLLGRVPESRLLLHAPHGSPRQRARDLLAREGIDPERVSFVGRVPLRDYLELHHQIDVALDPFPFGGGRTTCDALWMGVPVVSLVGRTAVGRGGASILSNVGLPELLARSPEEYVRIAADLTRDAVRLNELRLGLRERMRRSPLMDEPRFARNIESAYRAMWRTWSRLAHRTASPEKKA
jgi:predicted O-linked N-acetylglucosamine transferase (SPINDLY family)